MKYVWPLLLEAAPEILEEVRTTDHSKMQKKNRGAGIGVSVGPWARQETTSKTKKFLSEERNLLHMFPVAWP
jgi:hypothetical protein